LSLLGHPLNDATMASGGQMTDGNVVLSRKQRDAILKAVEAIQRQVSEAVGQSQWRALYVIGSNLSIIQANLSQAPRISSN
jgi:hypothetical protein